MEELKSVMVNDVKSLVTLSYPSRSLTSCQLSEFVASLTCGDRGSFEVLPLSLISVNNCKSLL